MSEEKVIEHSHKALKLAKDKNIGLVEKIKGFFEEIVIIVLAVSITLLFHNWNDERHERAIEREFLTGIEADLTHGANGVELSIKNFQPTIDYYSKAWKQISTNKPDAAYIDSLGYNLINTNYFVFDDGRFEGFKSSGYLRLIENKELQAHLLSLYSVYMPFEKDADANVFHTREHDYNTYIGTKTDADSLARVHVSKLLADPAVRYQFSRYTMVFEERKQHKQQLAKKMREVAAEIEKDLNR